MFLLARYYFYTKFGVVKNAVRLARRFIGRVSWNASKSTTEIRLVPAWRSRVDDGGGLNAVDKLARINVGGAIWIQNNIDAIAVRQAVQEARVDSHAVVGRVTNDLAGMHSLRRAPDPQEHCQTVRARWSGAAQLGTLHPRGARRWTAGSPNPRA